MKALSIVLSLLALASSSLGQLTYEDYYFVTVAGDRDALPGWADGLGAEAKFNSPGRLSVDLQGNLFVADSGNHTIRKVTARGMVTTMAGAPGLQGTNDGFGFEARFSSPFGTAPDAFGNVYVADFGNHLIRRISSDGTVSTVAGLAGVTNRVDGLGSNAHFNGPVGITVISSGDILITDYRGNAIRKMTPAGLVTTVAGGTQGATNGTGLSAQFDGPSGIAEDPQGNFFIVDQRNHLIRKMTTQGDVTTFAGGRPFGHVDGVGTNARFFFPTSLGIDRQGNLFIADNSNRLIRKITPQGVVTTLGGYPIETGTADGQGWRALFFGPTGIAVDSNGDLHICDYFNHNIRKGSALYISPVTPPPAITNNMFTFSLSSTGLKDVVVEGSPDLIQWAPVATNAPAGLAQFQEPAVFSNRFYRLRMP